MIKILKRYRSPIILFFSIVLILIIGNLLRYQRLLNVMQIIGIMLLFVLYFKFLDLNLRLVISSSWSKRGIGTLLFLFVLYTFIPFSKWVIYDFYPLVGIFLFKINSEFDAVQFKLRVGSSFSSILLFTIGNVFFRKRKFKQSLLEADNSNAKHEIDNLRYQLSLRDINPHFVESILSTGIGRSLMGKGRESADMLIRFNQVLRYVLDQDIAGMKAVPLKIEWDYFIDLTDILQWKYGDATVELQVDADWEKCRHHIIPMSLVTVLENAIKYAVFQFEGAIVISLVVSRYGFVFECRNLFDPVQRVMMKSSNFGLGNLRQRLCKDEQCGILHIEESGNEFIVRIVQNKFNADGN
ncbi:histidine kinase [Sphingobacterium sp. HMA12]|uniref:histidine kinase n=1 Tax=Sphingobacterium sp. HMA12 TaxID=2050894 RepID=UPI000CE9FA13|nr:sensor histidine kinase [Sphingobacterium sp. HMA12]